MMDDPEILDAVLALPEAEREDAIREACGGQTERVELLRALVEIAAGRESTDADATDAKPALDPEHLREGDRVGRYVVATMIGQGGYGEVYEAFDLELRRSVALKVLRVDRNAKEEDRRRFVREAQTLARIDHPNVVRVYDAGEHEGRRYLTMELVQGRSLAGWLRERTTPDWRKALQVLLPAAHGLIAAHAEGIVHRDFKPSNVMIEPGGRVVVTDFGVARVLGSPTPTARPRIDGGSGERAGEAGAHNGQASGDTGLATASAVGTPYYMAPEQFEGTAVPRSDQYSFCLVLLEALSPQGRRPAVARLQTTSSSEPASRSFSEVAAPRWLRRILARGLAVEPSDRYVDMAALVEEIEARRRRIRLTGWAVGLLLLSAPSVYGVAAQPEATCNQWDEAKVLGALEPTWRTLSEHADTAEHPDVVGAQVEGLRAHAQWNLSQWASARTESCQQRANGLVGAPTAEARDACFAQWHGQLTRRLRWIAEHPEHLRVPGLVLELPRNPLGCRYVDAARADEAALEPEVRAAVEQKLDAATSHRIAGEFESGTEAATQALALVEEAGHEGYRARVLHRLGVLAARAHAPERAVELLRRAIEDAERLGMDGLATEVHASLAETLALSPEFSPQTAAPFIGLARAKMARRGGRHDEVEPALDIVEGHLAFAQQRYTDAEAAYAKALLGLQALGGPADFRAAAVRSALAHAVFEGGQTEEGLALAEEGLRARAEAVGAAHPLVVADRARLGTAYVRAVAVMPANEAQWLAMADKHLAEAVRLGRITRGRRSVSVVVALAERIDVQRRRKKIDEVVAQDLADCVLVFDGPPQPELTRDARVRGLRIVMHAHHERKEWVEARDVATRLVRAHERLSSGADPGPRDDELMLIDYQLATGQSSAASQRLSEHRSRYQSHYGHDLAYAARVDALSAKIQAHDALPAQ